MTDGPAVDGTGRLEAFSDGVMAIIVTLLIFEVRLLVVPRDAGNQEMVDAFLRLRPNS